MGLLDDALARLPGILARRLTQTVPDPRDAYRDGMAYAEPGLLQQQVEWREQTRPMPLRERLKDISPMAGALSGMAMPIAFHSTYSPFKNFDWSRLGSVTRANANDTSAGWAMNLAKIGPWSSASNVGRQMAAPHTLKVEVGGRAKSFRDLNTLEAAVRRAGGPEKLRQSLVDRGYGHIKVTDTEFGGTSFVSLAPENFKVID